MIRHASSARRALLLLGFAWPLVLPAADESPPPLFESHEPLELVIRAPIDAIVRDRSEEPEYREGVLIVMDDAGNATELTLNVRPRGHSRRNPDVCRFPPLRLNLKKKEVEGTVFAGQDKLKLVTHCRDRSERNEQYLYQEYLIYRTFNALTEKSFRVRLAEIEYVDTEDERRPVTAPAFIIEHKDGLADRLGIEAVDVERISLDALVPEATAMIGVFQLMIGNTDWAVRAGPAGDVCCHNVEPFVTRDAMFLPVPYDFDSTGLIDPPYAAPHESLDIRSVRDRLYRGFCRHQELAMKTLAQFNEQKDAIYELFRTQPGLEERTVERSLEYFDGFYEIINDPEKVDREITEECRG